MTEKKGKKMRFQGIKSLATLWGAGTIAAATLLPGNLSGDLRDAYEYFSHSGKTVSEIVRGTEGERSVNKLNEALAIVKEATGNYSEAGETLRSNLIEREELVSSLKRIYEENETAGRELGRLYVHFTGMLNNIGEVGNSIKPGFMDGVDNAIAKLYGMDPVEARERSEKVKKFYDDALEFYNSREDNENALSAFCDHLGKKVDDLESQNVRINSVLGGLEGTLTKTYDVEDRVIEEAPTLVDAFRNRSPEDLEKPIRDYSKSVGDVKSDVEAFTPVPDRGYDWITFMLNPMVLGGIFAGVTKVAYRGSLPGAVSKPITKTLAYPTHVLTSTAEKLASPVLNAGWDGAKYLGSQVRERTEKVIKKTGDFINSRRNRW